jgi:hypothetical protein
MSAVKTSKKEKYLGDGMFESDFKPPIIKGKTFAERFRNAIKAFLEVKQLQQHSHKKVAK